MEEIPYSAQLLLRQGLEADNAKLRAEVSAYEKRIPELCKDYLTQLEAATLQVDEMSKRIYKIGLLCDAVPGLQHGFCPDIGEPRDNLTRIKIALDGFIKKPVGEGPTSRPCCVEAYNRGFEMGSANPRTVIEKRIEDGSKCPACGRGVTGVDPLCDQHYAEYLGQNRARGNGPGD